MTGLFSFGVWNNDEPLQPFTINEALPQLALPRTSAQAEAHVLSANLGLVSRPWPDWRFSGRVRQYGYDNRTGHVDIPQFINYDTSLATSTTGGPEPYAHDRTNLDADATWSGIQPLADTCEDPEFIGARQCRAHDPVADLSLRALVCSGRKGAGARRFRARTALAFAVGSHASHG